MNNMPIVYACHVKLSHSFSSIIRTDIHVSCNSR
ncbi:hypothetical protein KP509_05G073000 [Ceratopteris richardii]|uniref:Uncharacterized protein n=1 Tax=Ceratopteris richardii TaxID=49495 RepID=A0A8T2UVI6_CERRI|nr:hypothetical protein KP509_05G073000 [Ceratopteris richardii]